MVPRCSTASSRVMPMPLSRIVTVPFSRSAIDPDLQLCLLAQQRRLGDGLEPQPVIRVRGVGDQLPQENVPVAVQGMDHQFQQLTDFGLEAAGFFLCVAHRRAILGIARENFKRYSKRRGFCRLAERLPVPARSWWRQSGADEVGQVVSTAHAVALPAISAVPRGAATDRRLRKRHLARQVPAGVRPVVDLIPQEKHEFHRLEDLRSPCYGWCARSHRGAYTATSCALRGSQRVRTLESTRWLRIRHR